MAFQSAQGLCEEGINTILFSAVSSPAGLNKDNKFKVISTEQQDILNDPSRFRAIHQGLWNFKAKRQFETILSGLDPGSTIIHIHSWTKALSSSIVRAAIKNNFNVVFTLHDYFSACPNGGFYNYQKNEICQLRALSLNCILENCDKENYLNKIWRVTRNFIQKEFGHIPRGIQHFITINDFSRNILSPYLPQNKNLYHLDNPINIDNNIPVDIRKNKNFLFIGRLSVEKGADIFAKAASLAQVKAHFIGDGPCRPELQKEFPKFQFIGWQSHNEVQRQLKNARALVFPSRWYETQGLVVYEAAALGIPSIVADVSAPKNFIDHGENGLLFKTGDINDLNIKIGKMNNDSIAANFGKKAYEKFWQNPPTLRSHIKNLLKIYGEILTFKGKKNIL